MICTICHIHELSGRQQLYCSNACQRIAWKRDNPEKYLAGKRAYRERNKDKIALYHRAYKAQVKHVKTSIANNLKAAYPCLRCGTKDKLEIHHIKHQLLGGGVDDLNNLVVLCKPCHARWHKFFNTDYWKF